MDESRRINREDKYFIKLTNSSFRSIGTISTEEISTASMETRRRSDVCRYETICDTRNTIGCSSISANNTIRRLEQISWKYKNPHSVSVCDRMCCEESNRAHGSDNILNEDEPQEGKTKQCVLPGCREYLANHQESCGTPRIEYSFAALITVMAKTTARSLWALLYMLINIVPIIQMFSFILKFVLDKVLNIRETRNLRQVMVKFAILAVQLLSVHVCLLFILSFIVFPIVQMVVGITVKLVAND